MWIQARQKILLIKNNIDEIKFPRNVTNTDYSHTTKMEEMNSWQ